MFRLGTGKRPEDAEELARAVREGLSGALIEGSREPIVTTDATGWPALGRLGLELTGAAFGGATSPFGAPGDDVEPGPTATALAIGGRPVTIGGTEVDLSIDAQDVRFSWSTAEAGETVLSIDGHAGGGFSLFVSREALERRVEAALRAKAEPQGAKILAVELGLESAGENRVEIEVAVTLRIMFKAKVRAKAGLSFADNLALVVGDASVVGEGMAGKTVAGLVRPQLAGLTGKEFALGTLLPQGIRVEQVDVRVDDGILIRGGLAPRPAE